MELDNEKMTQEELDKVQEEQRKVTEQNLGKKKEEQDKEKNSEQVKVEAEKQTRIDKEGFDINEVIDDVKGMGGPFDTILTRKDFVKSSQSDKTASAGSDGITYNPEYFKSLTRSERKFVLAHEVLHIHLKHVDGSFNKNKFQAKDILSAAFDAQINAQLVESFGLEPPREGVFVKSAHLRPIEEVYNDLCMELNKPTYALMDAKYMEKYKIKMQNQSGNYKEGMHDQWQGIKNWDKESSIANKHEAVK